MPTKIEVLNKDYKFTIFNQIEIGDWFLIPDKEGLFIKINNDTSIDLLSKSLHNFTNRNFKIMEVDIKLVITVK